MNKVLAFLSVMLIAASCVSKQPNDQQQETSQPTTRLEQLVDSMKQVHPNWDGNPAIADMMSEELTKQLHELPGLLNDSQFNIVGIGEVAGHFVVMMSLYGIEDVSLLVSCEDCGKDMAARLDKGKLYRITGGTITETEHAGTLFPGYVHLGQLTVKDLTVEEIPGSHYESHIPAP